MTDTALPSEPPPSRTRIDIRCAKCSSTNVTRDAWAVWDVERQEWSLGAVFDAAVCEQCDEETSLVEETLGQSKV